VAGEQNNPWSWLARWVKCNPIERWHVGTLAQRRRATLNVPRWKKRDSRPKLVSVTGARFRQSLLSPAKVQSVSDDSRPSILPTTAHDAIRWLRQSFFLMR
jgi:hypothetical protein